MTRRRVPNLSWRITGGQHVGRWNIGPRLRAHGFRAVDLWGPPGLLLGDQDWSALGFDAPVSPLLRRKPGAAPLSPADAEAAVKALNRAAHAQIAARQGGGAGTGRRAYTANLAPPAVTVRDVLERWLDDRAGTRPDGRPWVAPNTLKSDRTAARTIIDWIGDEPPAIITKDLLVHRFWVWREARGAHMAEKTITKLCAALRHCAGRAAFPDAVMPPASAYSDLGITRAPARLRVALPDETAALLRAFDDPAGIYDELGTPAGDRVLRPRPSMGDALVLMLWTCARVGDALELRRDNLIEVEGAPMIHYRPAKTGWGDHDGQRWLTVPVLGPLPGRLAAMQRRARILAPGAAHLVINEDTAAPWRRSRRGDGDFEHNAFSRLWRLHRDLAGQLVPSLVGQGRDATGKPWLPFRAQDCRDTAATRLYRATGGDLAKVSLYHGSSPAALVGLMRHYIEIDAAASSEVGRRLEAYATERGITI